MSDISKNQQTGSSEEMIWIRLMLELPDLIGWEMVFGACHMRGVVSWKEIWQNVLKILCLFGEFDGSLSK